MKPKYFIYCIGLFLLISGFYTSQARINPETKRYVYFGLKSGPSASRIKNVTYEHLDANPQFQSSSGRSNKFFDSILLGTKIFSTPIRIEAEFMRNGNTHFQRIYTLIRSMNSLSDPSNPSSPWVITNTTITGFNNIIITSKTNIINLYFDWHLQPLTIYFNLGNGITKNTAHVVQSSDNFNGYFFAASKSSFTTSLGAGVAKRLGRFCLNLGYQYINKGHFETGWISQGLNEKFTGKILSHNLQASVRYYF